MAGALLPAAGPAERLIADKAYDANWLRQALAERGVEAVIPTTSSRKQPIPYDAVAYRAAT